MTNTHLTLAIAALLAFPVAAVQAQTAPQAQPQPEQQQPMPAPAPASPEQVAQCDQIANSIVTSLKSKDFDGATSDFNDDLKPVLSADKLKEGWTSLMDQYGQPKSIGHASEGQTMDQYTIVTVPMEFEKAHLGAQVACSNAGEVASLRIGVMQNGGAASKS